MDPNVIKLLQSVSEAEFQVGSAIIDLNARLNDVATSDDDKTEIEAQLPGLRLNQRELQARQVGLAANAETMDPPDLDVLQAIADATANLANQTAQRASVGLIVSAVGAVMSAVPRPTG